MAIVPVLSLPAVELRAPLPIATVRLRFPLPPVPAYPPIITFSIASEPAMSAPACEPTATLVVADVNAPRAASPIATFAAAVVKESKAPFPTAVLFSPEL